LRQPAGGTELALEGAAEGGFGLVNRAPMATRTTGW
jgi:hypothetical protein